MPADTTARLAAALTGTPCGAGGQISATAWAENIAGSLAASGLVLVDRDALAAALHAWQFAGCIYDPEKPALDEWGRTCTPEDHVVDADALMAELTK